jgi:hypothetical protein
MIKEALGRLVVRLYPQEGQSAAGSELVGTLLDAGEVSLGAYLLQLTSLLRAGLWSRARVELTRPFGQIAASALDPVAFRPTAHPDARLLLVRATRQSAQKDPI